jgi:hypothetical protein
VTLAAIMEGVDQLTKAFGPSHFGANKIDRAASPRRWVWVPDSAKGAPAGKSDGTLHTRVVTVQVHCWGWDEAEAEWMQDALLSAARQLLGAGQVAYLGEAWTPREDSARGAVCTTLLELRIPVARVTFPLGPRPPAPKPGQPAVIPTNPVTTVTLKPTSVSATPEE